MRNALLLLFSCSLALLVAEGALRLLSPVRLGFAYRDGHFVLPEEFPFDLANLPTNSRGFHDVEYGPKEPGVTRVVLLGDSYVAARSVTIPEIVGQRLEWHLSASGSGRYEVLSWGQPAVGQRQQLEWLMQLGPLAQPDIVVTLFLSLNDVRNDSEELTAVFLKQLPNIVSVRPDRVDFPGSSAPLFLIPGSVLNQLISHRLAVLLGTRNLSAIPIDYYVYALKQDELWRRAWQETQRLLLATSRRAVELGARYVLVSASTPLGVWGAEEGLERLMEEYPAMRDGEWDLDLVDRKLARFAEWNGIPFLALEPRFREVQRTDRRLHWKHDGHWNAEGNDLAGRVIAEFLLGSVSASRSTLPVLRYATR